MKIYIGTHLQEREHRDFSVAAAQQGLSKSELLRRLAQQLIAAKGRGSERGGCDIHPHKQIGEPIVTQKPKKVSPARKKKGAAA